MKFGLKERFIVINKKASSLYSLIANGQYRATSLGPDTWKTLLGSLASLEANCNKEGFNVLTDSGGYWPKARIGIFGSGGYVGGSPRCYHFDSQIGFGFDARGFPDDNTCGNEADGYYQAVERHIMAMGYILVQ